MATAWDGHFLGVEVLIKSGAQSVWAVCGGRVPTSTDVHRIVTVGVGVGVGVGVARSAVAALWRT